jgi:serine/threonine protein phosphatase PrpC
MIANELEASNIDSQYSGSTICMVFIIGDVAWFANLGDSRAILINHDPLRKNPIAVPFATLDHKPEDDHERQRIEFNGGRVMP